MLFTIKLCLHIKIDFVSCYSSRPLQCERFLYLYFLPKLHLLRLLHYPGFQIRDFRKFLYIWSAIVVCVFFIFLFLYILVFITLLFTLVFVQLLHVTFYITNQKYQQLFLTISFCTFPYMLVIFVLSQDNKQVT